VACMLRTQMTAWPFVLRFIICAGSVGELEGRRIFRIEVLWLQKTTSKFMAIVRIYVPCRTQKVHLFLKQGTMEGMFKLGILHMGRGPF
jgi:hypothetical protein